MQEAKMVKPPSLYKYRAVSERSISSITSSSVYFSAPRDFNDPFDCAIKLKSSIYIGPTPEDYQGGTEEEDLEHIKHFGSEMFEGMISDRIDDFLDNQGVCCFASRQDNLLMWSHYADSYQGYCLEFSTDARLFDTVRPVIYRTEVPTIEEFNGGLRGAISPDLTPLFHMKSDVWAYEQEWRLYARTPGPLVYEPEALTAIYFGPNIAENWFVAIALNAYRTNPRIRLFRSHRETAQYRLTFEEKSTRFCR